MKGALIIFLSLLCLSAATVQCYSGKSRDPLGKLLKDKRTKRSKAKTFVIEEHASSNEYSPVYIPSQDGLKELDKIVQLPGQPADVTFSQYSGYVTVDSTAGRALFYWLTESSSDDSSTKPLVLWLNGGPGCSSIGNGAMTELGPFRVNPDGKTLWYNDKAWNTVANILFLESPAGVGFSYSNTSSDYETGDTKTAADSYTFLINWLERFPEYKTRDFFITGESYAGHYVPQLAQLIIDYEDEATGSYDFVWSHALISDESHAGIVKYCNFSSSESDISEECDKYMEIADGEIGDIFPYDIYAPLCGSNSSASFDPCSDDYVFAYLNLPEVQKALHANTTGTPGPWEACSDLLDWNDEPDSVLSVIKELMASDISVWIYSGDTDGRVPVTTTRYSMAKLGAPVKTPWYPLWDTKT